MSMAMFSVLIDTFLRSSTVWTTPSCIYSPTSADEFAKTVKILRSFNATFAIKGGGHSPVRGFSSINNGILIEMSQVKDLTYDSKSETVRAGFGNTWEDIYSHLEAFDGLVVGGREPTVGLALLLGGKFLLHEVLPMDIDWISNSGGLSHLSNRYGFASDNAISFELVTANGTVVVANSTSNSANFYGLKAGSNNFGERGGGVALTKERTNKILGILTHTTLRTYPVGPIWGGSFIYTDQYWDQVMLAFAQYQREGQLDRDSALLSYIGINNNTIYVTLVYFQPISNPQAFPPFYNIPFIFNGTGIFPNLTSLISQQVDRVVPRWTFGATSFLLDEATYVDVGRLTQNMTARLGAINDGSMVLMPQPISASMISQSLSMGQNTMTSELNATAMMWFCINVGWNLPADDDMISEILLETLGKIEDLAKSRKFYNRFIFQNDAHSAQDPIRSYGENAYRRLKIISKRIDLDGMFQKQVPGGFKLRA